MQVDYNLEKRFSSEIFLQQPYFLIWYWVLLFTCELFFLLFFLFFGILIWLFLFGFRSIFLIEMVLLWLSQGTIICLRVCLMGFSLVSEKGNKRGVFHFLLTYCQSNDFMNTQILQGHRHKLLSLWILPFYSLTFYYFLSSWDFFFLNLFFQFFSFNISIFFKASTRGVTSEVLWLPSMRIIFKLWQSSGNAIPL